MPKITPWVPTHLANLTRPQQLALEVIATHSHSWQSNQTDIALNLVKSQPTEALMLRGLVQYQRSVDGLKVRNWLPLGDPANGNGVRGNGQYAVELTPAGAAMWAAAQH